MSKSLKKLWDIITTILVVALVLLAVLLSGVRFVGLTPYVVLSGSMEPVYHVGSLIYVKKAAPEEIVVGDPITFYMSDGDMVATHRVIEIMPDGSFRTKGDANDAADGAPVPVGSLIGRPVFTIPQLGYFSHWITHPPGKYVAAMAVVVLLVLIFAPGIIGAAAKADRRDAEKRAEREEA